MTLILNLTLWAALLAFGIIILRTISRDIGPKEISPWAASGISAGFALTLFLALNDGSNGWPGYLILSLLAAFILFAVLTLRHHIARKRLHKPAVVQPDQLSSEASVIILNLKADLPRNHSEDGYLHLDETARQTLQNRRGRVTFLPWPAIAPHLPADGPIPLLRFQDQSGTDIWLYDDDQLRPIDSP